jgi:hypothetical protein
VEDRSSAWTLGQTIIWLNHFHLASFPPGFGRWCVALTCHPSLCWPLRTSGLTECSDWSNALGRRIELTGKEFSLLEYLMLNAGRRVTRSMIIEHVWNLTFDTTTNVVDVYINYVETTSALHIAFGEGIDYSVLYAIEQMMGCHTETCMAVPSFVRKNLQSISGHRGESEVVFDIAIAFVWHPRKSASPAVVLFFGCVFGARPDLHSTSCCAFPRPTPSERFPLPCCRASRCLHPRRAKRCKRKAAPRVFHRNNPVLCDEQPLLSFLESTH